MSETMTAEDRNRAEEAKRIAETASKSAVEKVVAQLVNSPQVRADIFEACQELDRIDAARKVLNMDSQAVYAGLESKHGIHRAALRYARTFCKASDEQREGFDYTYATARQALGKPIEQRSLFDDDGGAH